jgi:hypothetical protein
VNDVTDTRHISKQKEGLPHAASANMHEDATGSMDVTQHGEKNHHRWQTCEVHGKGRPQTVGNATQRGRGPQAAGNETQRRK